MVHEGVSGVVPPVSVTLIIPFPLPLQSTFSSKSKLMFISSG